MAIKRRFQDNVLVYRLVGQEDGSVQFKLDFEASEIEYDLLKYIEDTEVFEFSENGDIEVGLTKIIKVLKKSDAKIKKAEFEVLDNEREGFTTASLKLKFPRELGFETPTSSKPRVVPITKEMLEKYETA